MRYIRNLIWLMLAPVMALAAGCSMIEQPPRPCPEENGAGENVRISFQVFSTNIIRDTRSDDQNHEEIDSEWRNFEDGIYERDFAFFVFLGETETAPLLMKVTDIFQQSTPDQMITGGMGSYTISATIKRAILEEKLGHELNPNGKDQVYFRIVALANCYSPSTGGDFNTLDASTYGSLIASASNWTFDLGEIYNPNEQEHSAEGIYKGYIPMFGTMLARTTEAALYASRPEDRIRLGDLWLLRALAKVRIIDAIKSKDASGLPRIESAVLAGSASRAYPLPYNALNYENGNQVHTPRICTTPGEDKGPTFPLGEYILGTYPSGSMTRIGYVPEQRIEGEDPAYHITVTFSVKKDAIGNDIPDKQETYIVPMTGFKGQTINFGSDILRNHIYTLQVNDAKTGVPADITINVADWDEHTLDLDYTDQVIVGTGGELKWIDGTFYDNNRDSGRLVVSPWHDNAPVAAQCTFGLSSPAGATWTANLITTSGSQGAFRFLDADGNQVESISGTVDNKLTTLSIVTTDPAPSQQNTAIIQVVVRLGNGKYMEAPLCGQSSYKNYTIIQNQQ